MTKYLLCLWWVPMVVFKITAILLGLVAVPLALISRHLTYDLDVEADKHWPDFFWLWGNDEEQCPDWWKDKASKQWWTRYWPQFWWYAVRNPANNMRFLFEDGVATYTGSWPQAAMEAGMLLVEGQMKATRWARSGQYIGYRSITITEHPDDGFESPGLYTEKWFGFKVGSSVPGLGFALSYRPNREIGT